MKWITKIVLVGGCAAGLAVGLAAAQERDPLQVWRGLRQRFDVDLDGRISRAEYTRAPAVFRRLDKNRDGYLTEADFQPSTEAAPTVTEVANTATAEQLEYFESKVRPVLAQNCFECHNPDQGRVKGSFRADSRQALLTGGPSGPALVPGDVEGSLLIKAVRYGDEDYAMPPKQKLPEEQIKILEDWVRMGAPWPSAPAEAEPAMQSYKIEYDYEAARRDHWAFQPLQSTEPPQAKESKWSQHPIDRFLYAAMEAKGVRPVQDADKRTWLRRVTLDLTGLPPNPEDYAAFEADRSPQAYETVVDRLLASPAYGERFGRHWLDVARYAESSGKESNVAYPHAWRYRDWVVQAFQEDKPYNEFLTEQLAGDLLPATDPTEQALNVIATGYLALGPKSHNARDRQQFQLDVADEQIDTISQGMLGLTISCARCHDHKFDPIPIEDYYALAGILLSTDTRYGTPRAQGNNHPGELVALPKDAQVPNGPTMTPLVQAALERLRTTVERQAERVAEENMKARTGVDAQAEPINRVRQRALEQQTAVLNELFSRFDDQGRANEKNRTAMGAVEGRARDIAVLQRGELDKPGAVVERGFLTVLQPYGDPAITKGSGRQELAQWITSESNPLTARVWVNRVWSHLFGDGLVSTVDNFGLSGQKPDHSELLDYLARTFMADGWSTKALVRRIVLTRAYRLASSDDPRSLAVDPEVVTLWRYPERRLEAEAIRDSMLYAAGLLETTPPTGSNSAFLEGVLRNEQVTALVQDRRPVRSMYLPMLRDQLPEALAVFDMADPSFVVGRREETNVATQALFLMNDPTVLEASDALASKLLAAPGNDVQRIGVAFERVLGRMPSSSEAQAVERFLADFDAQVSSPQGSPSQVSPSQGASQPRRARATRLGAAGSAAPTDPRLVAWSAFVQTLFQSAEFRFLG